MRKFFLILVAGLIVFAAVVTSSQTTTQRRTKTIRISADFVEQKGDQIYYRGKVFVNIEEDKVTLRAAEMYVRRVNDRWRIVEVPVRAEFSFDGGSAIADKINYDIDTRTGILTSATVTITDDKSKDRITVVADVLNFDLENDKYSGTKKGGVNITKGSITASAERFEYDKRKGELGLVGSVVINDPKQGIKMTASDAVVNTETNDLKGNNVSIELRLE